MELCLSLGDASKPFGSLKDDQQKQHQNIDLCMALGLNSSASVNKEEHEKTHKSYEEENDDDDEIEAPFQLNLLPLAPVPRRFSDYGSSENGSSGNMGMATAKGFDVNRFPATEEVSSGNRPFNCLNGSFGDGNILCGYKRDFEATVNDAVEAVRASDDEDDDENGVNTRKKLRLSKEQSAFLEESFKEHNTLNPKQKQALAKQLNLRTRQVEVWFQNRRARTKLKQTEVDCEYLKRCFETLTEENRRLQKELQDLRAVKASNPFNMTPLTMCPSCERVATTAAPPPAAAAMTGKTDSIPFPFTRPRFYPFSQNLSRPNQPSDGSWKLSKMHI